MILDANRRIGDAWRNRGELGGRDRPGAVARALDLAVGPASGQRTHSSFGWIDVPVFGPDGEPLHHRGVVAGAPGLYFAGRFFQYALTSSLLYGVGRDAEHIAARDVEVAGPAIP